MRIALFSEVYWPMVSGVSTTLRRTTEALTRRGHDVRVYTATYDIPAASPIRDHVHQSKSRRFFLSPEVQWANADLRGVIDDLRAFRPDVVHLATEWAMGLTGLRAARAIDAPIIASAHTDYESYATRYRVPWAVSPGWMYLRWFYRHARAVLAPTRAYAAHLNARGIDHTGVWSRGVDCDEFAPSFRCHRYREALGIGPKDKIVSYVGRIGPEKGVDKLLDAWAALSALHPRAHLVFTGRGLMETEIIKRKLPRVHLTGYKSGLDLAVAYASADVFAMPSVTETFGNVTLEAMASGVATVAVAAGGVMDFGIHDENVWLASPNRPDALAVGLDRLLVDAALRRRLATNARATALTRGWKPIFDGLVERYQSAAHPHLAAAA